MSQKPWSVSESFEFLHILLEKQTHGPAWEGVGLCWEMWCPAPCLLVMLPQRWAHFLGGQLSIFVMVSYIISEMSPHSSQKLPFALYLNFYIADNRIGS